MTADLDSLLEPRETVAYRTSGRSFVATFKVVALHALPLIMFTSVIMSTRLDVLWDSRIFYPSSLVGAVIIGIVIGTIVLLIAARGQRRDPDHAMITDRRFLFADSDWDSKMESLALAEIERISWTRPGVVIRLEVAAANGTVLLTTMQEAEALAKALADATGLAAPPPLGRMVWADLTEFGEALVACTILIALRHAFIPDDLVDPGGLFDFDRLWVLFAVLAVAVAAGLAFGPVVGAALMRPFVTAEQMQAGLSVGRRPWRIRVALAWAGLLYGRQLSYVPDRAETGGAGIH